MTLEARIEDVLRFARPLGFFEDEEGTDAEVARRLAQEFRTRFDDGRTRDSVEFEGLILFFDPTRVWYADPECDALPANRQYERWARGISRILRGQVSLKAVRETWGDGGTEVRVALELEDGRALTLATVGGSGWIDVGCLVDGFNQLLPPEGPRLARMPEEAYLLALTPRERAAFEARGWRFA